MDSYTTFNIGEIAVAAGVSSDIIRRRVNTRQASGDLPFGVKEFTYPQIKMILRRQSVSGKREEKDRTKVAILRKWLKEDGYRYPL